jgi:hypothetical protein
MCCFWAGLDVLLCWQLGGFGCMQLSGVIEVPLAAHAIVCGHLAVTRQSSLSSLWHSKEGRRIQMDRVLHEGCSELSEREPERLLRYTLAPVPSPSLLICCCCCCCRCASRLRGLCAQQAVTAAAVRGAAVSNRTR